jgi:hypothetical protein
MWPPKHHDHQPDDQDVERNETTPWRSIQDGLAYSIIVRLASVRLQQKKPKPAWSEDYLLGQWHDTALRSPATVEAQL